MGWYRCRYCRVTYVSVIPVTAYNWHVSMYDKILEAMATKYF